MAEYRPEPMHKLTIISETDDIRETITVLQADRIEWETVFERYAPFISDSPILRERINYVRLKFTPLEQADGINYVHQQQTRDENGNWTPEDYIWEPKAPEVPKPEKKRAHVLSAGKKSPFYSVGIEKTRELILRGVSQGLTDMEIAAIVGVCDRTVWKYRKKAGLPANKRKKPNVFVSN